MILIKPKVYEVIDNYTRYLINEGLVSQTRAIEKKDLIVQAIHANLNGIVNHRISPYKILGKDEEYRLYVYRDSKSRTQWGIAYQLFDDDNVIVHIIKNMKLISEQIEC